MSLDPYRSLPQAPHPVTPRRRRALVTMGIAVALGGLYAWRVPAGAPAHGIVVAVVGISIAVTLAAIALYRYCRA